MALRRRGTPGGSDLFPGFTDVAEIGTGRLATVYRARELGTNRLVALKLLNVRDASPRAVESFERESVALGALSSHPNIVTLFRTFRVADGRPVLVLELCTSSESERLRAGGRIPVQEAVSVAIKIAGALETAHRGGILHRDVKPQNILITEFGEPALADFGVAQLQSSTQTTAGLFDFTTLHVAPELLEGGATSAATDVYELASTLYQLIAGQAAFRSYEGESPASVILRIVRDPVQPVTAPDVPVQLSDLLIWAMSKDKDHRPPTAAEFAAELSQIEVAQKLPRTQFLIRDAAYGAGSDPLPTITRLPDRPVPPAVQVAPVVPPPPPVAPLPPPAPVAPSAPVLPPQPAPVLPLPAPPRPPVAPAAVTPPPAPVPPRPPAAPPRVPAPWNPAPPAPDPAVWETAVPPNATVVDIDEAEFDVPDDFALPPSPRDRPGAEEPSESGPSDEPSESGPSEERSESGPSDEPSESAPSESGPSEVYPIPPAGWSPDRPPEDVPVFAFRAPPPPAAPASMQASAPPDTPADALAGDLALDPMSLPARATLRAGLSAITVDEYHLTERLTLHKNRIPWPHVYGFQQHVEPPRQGAATHGSLTVLTSRGPVPLKATRRPIEQLAHLHALLDAYRLRAQSVNSSR